MLDKGKPLVFHRFFAGDKNASYLELNQMIAQILDIHFVNDRNSYCRLDENGDYEDAAITTSPSQPFVYTLKKSDLDFVLYVTDSVLVRLFDFTRAPDISFHSLQGSSTEREMDFPIEDTHGKIGMRTGKNHEYIASWCRGFQIVRTSESRDSLRARATDWNRTVKQYASFLVYDLKSKSIIETTCDPQHLDTYFTDTGKPLTTSPTFFRAEVLLKYESYPEKYSLGIDSIHCRGAWTLRGFELNEAGQVVVLLCDIADLPYSEQQHWRSMNERPRGTIPERMIKQQFEGEFSDDYDPLRSLVHILEKFPVAKLQGSDLTIWEYHGEIKNRKTSRLHYVFTDSSKEWEDQIRELAVVLNEGLRTRNLREIATKLGVTTTDLGSIKLLDICLQGKGAAPEDIQSIVNPLANLQRLRSDISVHANTSVPKGDLRRDVVLVLTECDYAMRKLAELIEKGYLNTP